MITIDEKVFLQDFDEFVDALVPLYQKERKERGLPELTEDEITNLFLDLREKYGVK